MNLSYQEIMDSVLSIPGMSNIGGRQVKYSHPLARKAEGKLYIVYMVYYYNDPNPDGFAIVDTETGKAELLSNAEAMDRLGIETFDEEPPEEAFDVGLSDDYDADPRDELEELFAEALGGDDVDWEAYRKYLGRLLMIVSESKRPFYWALRGEK